MFTYRREIKEEKEKMITALEKVRQKRLMPHIQQALRLNNSSQVCYANAGTNLIMSSPYVTSFMADLLQCGGILGIMQNLTMAMPNELKNLWEL